MAQSVKRNPNAGELDSIPGSGRSPGEGNGSPLQYSCLGNPKDKGVWWVFLTTGLFLFPATCAWNPPSSLPAFFPPRVHTALPLLVNQIQPSLEKEMATHSSVLAWRIPGTGAWWAAVYGVAQSQSDMTDVT